MTDKEENIDTTFEDLDALWIDDFEILDNEYKHYYTEELSFIKIHYIYINVENDIEKIKEEKFILTQPGILQKEELLGIIKHNSVSNQIKYSLLSILKFNINIEPVNLTNFLRSKDANIGSTFLQSIKNIESIKFDKTISMLQDINNIFIIFHQKIQNKIVSKHNKQTKKGFIISNTNKKTKRKELKETTP